MASPIDFGHGLGAQCSNDTTDSAAREGLDVVDRHLGVLPKPVCCGRFYEHANVGHSQKIACNRGNSDQFWIPWKLTLNHEGRTGFTEVSRRRDRNYGAPSDLGI